MINNCFFFVKYGHEIWYSKNIRLSFEQTTRNEPYLIYVSENKVHSGLVDEIRMNIFFYRYIKLLNIRSLHITSNRLKWNTAKSSAHIFTSLRLVLLTATRRAITFFDLVNNVLFHLFLYYVFNTTVAIRATFLL